MTNVGGSDGDGQPLEGLRERVHAVVPLIAELAADAEQQRKPADEVIDALKGTGLFRAFVPKRYGGYEIDLDLFFDLGVDIATACPSTGWISTFYMEHNWLLGLFGRELQEEVFSAQPFVLAPGSVNPSGEAIRHDDHVELTGHWQFGTGIVHADWVLLSGRIIGDEPPIPRMFLVPVDAVEVKDTWHVDGMAATGSRDIVATSIEVPLHRISKTPPPTWALALDEPYLRRIPMMPMLALTAAIPAVGCARRSVELFRDRMTERVMFGTGKSQASFSTARIRLANLTVQAGTIESTMRALAVRMTAHGRGEVQLSMLEHLEIRLAIAQLVRACRDVVRDVMEASGARAHFLDNEQQRIHRDIHMICAHTVFDIDLAAAEVGKVLLRELETVGTAAR
jgi:alkylation response protein AidB-like acyl-CoA dehydrogenase